jgi:hypothetical protein
LGRLEAEGGEEMEVLRVQVRAGVLEEVEFFVGYGYIFEFYQGQRLYCMSGEDAYYLLGLVTT